MMRIRVPIPPVGEYVDLRPIIVDLVLSEVLYKAVAKVKHSTRPADK